jgi:hypothetical protein
VLPRLVWGDDRSTAELLLGMPLGEGLRWNQAADGLRWRRAAKPSP